MTTQQSRPIKELLQLMLDKPEWFSSGLCSWAATLDIEDVAFHSLYNYIRSNRPAKYTLRFGFTEQTKGYWWPYGNIKPRIKWLKYHIKKNS